MKLTQIAESERFTLFGPDCALLHAYDLHIGDAAIDSGKPEAFIINTFDLDELICKDDGILTIGNTTIRRLQNDLEVA